MSHSGSIHLRSLLLAASLVLPGCGDREAAAPATGSGAQPAIEADFLVAAETIAPLGPAETLVGTTLRDAAPPPEEPLAPAGAVAIGAAAPAAHAEPVVHERSLGESVIRFWVARSVRTGRSRREYHFESSLENGGAASLRGVLRVASHAEPTVVAADCVPFGTIPPGATRSGDTVFVVSQDRAIPFDPATLHFSFEANATGASCADPGRVTLRRLNRSEYDHSVRELLGTARRPARAFPADDTSFGFDTIARSLAFSPLLLEKLDVAAVRLVADSLAEEPPAPQIAALRALCDPAIEGDAACHRRILGAFARRAWRRPLSAGEVESLGRIADRTRAAGGDFESALADGMEATLISPHFVFRVERDAHPRSAEAHALTDHELATRLAYFLWSAPPDATLDELADAGLLRTDAALAGQVARMLRDDRVRGFVDDFAGQWLATRALDDANPDYPYFETWGDDLKEAMRQETHLFLLDFVQGSQSFLGLLEADFTYLNDRLAAHYGLALPGGTEMVRVALPANGERGGILTHASLHTVKAFPRRSAPVKRGKWVLDELLCIDVPPPPPGVEGLLTDPNRNTLREQMERHRARSECASCHSYLDPIGLGLENYGPLGGYRTQDVAGAIDASGAFPDGRTFSGPREMAALLAADPSTPRCIAERVLVYALGRGLGDEDQPHLDAIAQSFADGGHRFESLAAAIVASPPFRMRRGETEPIGEDAQ